MNWNKDNWKRWGLVIGLYITGIAVGTVDILEIAPDWVTWIPAAIVAGIAIWYAEH